MVVMMPTAGHRSTTGKQRDRAPAQEVAAWRTVVSASR